MATTQGKSPFVSGMVVLATLLIAAPAAHAACKSPNSLIFRPLEWDGRFNSSYRLCAAGKKQYDASKPRCRSCKTKSMAQVDPLEKAADCERAIRLTFDPVHREILSNIREFWIALAQGRRYLSEDDLAAEIETIGRLQESLTAPSANKSFTDLHDTSPITSDTTSKCKPAAGCCVRSDATQTASHR